MSKTKTRPDIFAYQDYRIFLRDWISFMKSSGEKATLRSLSLKAGLADCYLSHSLKGMIPMTEASLKKILPHLKLKQNEETFLENLRCVGDSLDPVERTHAFKKIQKTLAAKGVRPETVGSYRYLNKWYYVAIREMVDMKGFSLDPKWIQKRLKHSVSIKEISRAIKFLTENGFIDVKNPSKPKIRDKLLRLEEGFNHLALHEFYKQMGELHTQALYNTPREERMVLSHSIAIPKEKHEEFKKFLRKTLKTIEEMAAVENKDPDSVYHFALASFPLAMEPQKKRKAS